MVKPQHNPVYNRSSLFLFRWKLPHDMFWLRTLFVLLFRWQLLYNVLWSGYLQIWLCCWRMWNGMLREQLRAKLHRWKLHCVVLLRQLLSRMYQWILQNQLLLRQLWATMLLWHLPPRASVWRVVQPDMRRNLGHMPRRKVIRRLPAPVCPLGSPFPFCTINVTGN